MSLKSRLSQLQSQAGAGFATNNSSGNANELRQRLARLKPEQRIRAATARPGLSELALVRSLGGEVISDGLIRIRQQIPLAGRCGTVALCELEREPHLPGETQETGRAGIYFDTETTGLSGGSGTLAFLIGSARLSTEAIELDQWLITRFAAEPVMLTTFANHLRADDRLVSYNGKSYDLPLLLTRYRMQALPHPFTALPHLDLLHPVRRLFGRSWPDCRLATLEQHLLGLSRHHDLPGAEAPTAWFDYVRKGDGERLIRVVEHNRQDVLSLVLAHRLLTKAIRHPVSYKVDLTALARWLGENDPAAARHLLQTHIKDLDDAGKRLLGRFARRDGDWQQAVRIWQELATRGCTQSLERLAKYHEHISRDLISAQHYSEQLPAEARHQQRRLRLAKKRIPDQNSLFEVSSHPSKEGVVQEKCRVD
ncbi:MAG: ribonuclease H-like domain-containing protein [Chromatiales bacterium]|jgi:hypothetical protein